MINLVVVISAKANQTILLSLNVKQWNDILISISHEKNELLSI